MVIKDLIDVRSSIASRRQKSDDYEPDNGNGSTDSQEEKKQYAEDEIKKQDGFHNKMTSTMVM